MIRTWSAFSCEENTKHYFDMGWVKVFYRYGVIPGSLYVAAHLYLLWKLWKRRDGCGLVVFVMFAVYTVVEAHLVSVYLGRNYLLLFLVAESASTVSCDPKMTEQEIYGKIDTQRYIL